MDGELIKKLIEEGLELYGYGRVDEAIEKWKEVLKIDPNNAIVLDYLATAGVDVEKEKERIEGELEREQLLKAVEEGRSKEILKMLEDKKISSLEEFCFAEVIRYALFSTLREKYVGGDVIPVLKVSPSALVNKKFTPREGFLLSQIDGNVSLKDLADLCNLSEEEAYFIIAKFEEEGIVEFG